jgi:hypothetical protein
MMALFAKMLAVRRVQPKVLWAVVIWSVIPMVNAFLRRQRTTQGSLHHQDVL